MAVAGSAISACDKIRERGCNSREGTADTLQLDHPTAKDCFLHFANGVVIKQREQLAPAHTRSWTFHVEKRFLIPNLYAQKKAEGLAI